MYLREKGMGFDMGELEDHCFLSLAVLVDGIISYAGGASTLRTKLAGLTAALETHALKWIRSSLHFPCARGLAEVAMRPRIIVMEDADDMLYE